MDEKKPIKLKILLLGDSSKRIFNIDAGKTSISDRFTRNTFSTFFISTIGVDYAIKDITINNKLFKLEVN